MAEEQLSLSRGGRAAVWTAAVLTVVVLLLGGLFVVSQVFRALGETFCTTETRVPADAGTVSGPTFADPFHLRCDYRTAGTRVFADPVPLLEIGFVVLAVLVASGLVLWAARRIASGRT
jgi:hypothetical protein